MKTLVEYLTDYMDHQKALNFSRYTIRHSRYCVGVFLRWFSERYQHDRPDQLRVVHLRAWQKQLSERTTWKGAMLKSRSVNKHVETMNGFLRHLATEGLVSRPLAEVLEYVKEPVFLPGSVLSHEQARKLMEQVNTDTPDGYRLRAMLEVLYSSGIRVAELLGLDIGEVDFKNATARVMGKGMKERMVPLGRTALQYLESYLRAVRPLLVKDSGEKALFVDFDGKRFPYHTFRRLIKACAKKAKLDICVTAHTFRRSCATELLRGGANMYHVKELLGHESLETLKHYAKLTITDLKATHAKCHPRENDGR